MGLVYKDEFHKNVVNEIAKEQELDRRVVNFVITRLFLFIRNAMKEPMDILPIVVRYFGKFAIRSGSKKDKLQKELQPS